MSHWHIVKGTSHDPALRIFRHMGEEFVAANFAVQQGGPHVPGLYFDSSFQQQETPPPMPSVQNRPFLTAVIDHFCAPEKPVADLPLQELVLMISNNHDAAVYFSEVHIPMFSKGMDLHEMHRRQAKQLSDMLEWEQIRAHRLMPNGPVPSDH